MLCSTVGGKTAILKVASLEQRRKGARINQRRAEKIAVDKLVSIEPYMPPCRILSDIF